jgi:hypothetical protein
MVVKPTIFLQYSTTPVLQYSTIDRLLNFRKPLVYLIIGYRSVFKYMLYVKRKKNTIYSIVIQIRLSREL